MFRITEHLDKLQIIKKSSAKIVAVCPVCGEDNLKINLHTNAYSCYSNACPSIEIRKAMDLDVFVSPLTNRLPPPKIVTPVIYPRQVRLFSVGNYSAPTPTHYYSRKYGATVEQIEYYYSATQKVKRVNRPGGKDIYPLYTLDGQEWHCGNNGFPLYNELYIPADKAYTYYLVEGEKAASILTKTTGWLALSPSGGAWSEKHLTAAFRRLFWQIETLVILPDNDTAGASKATLVRDCAWRCDIPAKIVDLSGYYEKEKEDVVDLIERGLNIKQILETEVLK